jgi:hypothetical protein
MRSDALKTFGGTFRPGQPTKIDEIGYLPVTAGGANLFFHLVNARYEKASLVLTSNKSFKDWGQVFGNSLVAAALLDRLLHHGHIVNIRDNSYRLRQYPAPTDGPAAQGPGCLNAPTRRARAPPVRHHHRRFCDIFNCH